MSTSEVGLYFMAIKASKILHESSLHHIFRSPMRFFDTQPVGRILSRFSQDVFAIDCTIPQIVVDLLWCFCDVISRNFFLNGFL